MDAITEHAQMSYSGEAPVMIAGSSEAALVRARRTVEDAGFRVADAVMLSIACARIEQQALASAVWIELDQSGDNGWDSTLQCVSRGAVEGRFAAIVSAPASLLDNVCALADDCVEVLIEANELERHAALALAKANRQWPHRAADIACDRSTERLRQLSDEVSRIAATLARLSSNPPVPSPPLERTPSGDVPDISAEQVRSVISARRLRSRYFPDELFADPAWDMMLDLLQAEIAQLRVPVSSLCIAAAVPATTALRWLKTLVQDGLFVRSADPHDGRRVFVELAPATSMSLRRYFEEVGALAVI